MIAPGDVAAVLLAAGRGTRFGGDKLLAPLDGKPLALHAADLLASIGFGTLIAVCRAGDALLPELLEARCFTIVRNHRPEDGLSRSLRLGVEAARGSPALLIALADMPFVSPAHIARLLDAFAGETIASSSGGQTMPPALFPRSAFDALATSKGDAGARELLQHARGLAAHERELADIDTLADLAAASPYPQTTTPAPTG